MINLKYELQTANDLDSANTVLIERAVSDKPELTLPKDVARVVSIWSMVAKMLSIEKDPLAKISKLYESQFGKEALESLKTDTSVLNAIQNRRESSIYLMASMVEEILDSMKFSIENLEAEWDDAFGSNFGELDDNSVTKTSSANTGSSTSTSPAAVVG